MKKLRIVCLIMALLMLAACSGNSTASPTPTNPPQTQQPDNNEASSPTETDDTQTQEPEQSASDKGVITPLTDKTYDLGGRKVVIAAWFDMTPQPSDANYADRLALQEAIEKKYNCKLEYFTTNNWHTYQSSLLLSAMSNEKIADVFIANFDSMVPQWVNGKFIAPIDDYFDFNSAQWNKDVNEEWAIKGKHYGISAWGVGLGHVVLFNKRIVNERGITDEMLYDLQRNGEWTWDKLAELAQKCTWDTNNDGENDIWGFGAFGTSPVCPEPLFYSNNSSPAKLTPDFKYQFNLDSPECIEALDFAHKLVDDYKVTYAGATDWGTWEQLWKQGKVAFYSVASWNMLPYKEDLKEDGIGLLLTPKGPSATDYVNAQSSPWGIFMQPMVEDKEAIGAIITELFYPYDWTNYDFDNMRPGGAVREWENWVFDDESIETIEMIEGRTRTLLGTVAIWFRDNVLWSDCGLKDQIPTRTYIDSVKQPSEQAFEDLWASTMFDE